jgi:hypothetical protein
MNPNNKLDKESIRLFMILGALTLTFVLAWAWYLNSPGSAPTLGTDFSSVKN